MAGTPGIFYKAKQAAEHNNRVDNEMEEYIAERDFIRNQNLVNALCSSINKVADAIEYMAKANCNSRPIIILNISNDTDLNKLQQILLDINSQQINTQYIDQ